MLFNKKISIILLNILILVLSGCGDVSPINQSEEQLIGNKNQNTTLLVHNITIDNGIEDHPLNITFYDNNTENEGLHSIIVQKPSHGILIKNGNSYIYTPSANYYGEEYFTYKICNEKGICSTEATVTLYIEAVNDVPIAISQDVTVNEDETKVITLNGTDIDGDSLTYIIQKEPKHGSFINSIYTPDANYNGVDSFTFIANDGKINSSEVVINIIVTAVNDTPVVLNNSMNLWSLETKALAYKATDIDGDTLRYEITVNPSQGVINTNGYYVPNTDARGEDVVKYKACDADGCSNEAILTITIKAPYITLWDTSIDANTSSNQLKIGTYPYLKYDYIIDWGDGNRDYNVHDEIIHTYTHEGNYTVKIAGQYPHSWFGNNSDGYYDAAKLQKILQWGDIKWKNMALAYYFCSNMQGEATDTPNLSNVTNMSSMFSGATNFNQSIANWDVSNITSMMGMFYQAKSFNQSIDDWDVSHVKNMQNMFAHATNFNQPISNWDVGSVTIMKGMFAHATNFNQPIFNWDVKNVTNMSFLFTNATNFNQPIGEWDVNKVTNMYFMFSGATNFNQPIGEWDISNVTNIAWMFTNAKNFNQPLGEWDVSHVTNMEFMFYSVRNFNHEIKKWDVSHVTNMRFMFFGANHFDQDLGEWDVSHVTNMGSMFGNITLSTMHYDSLLTHWNQLNLESNVPFSGGSSKYSNAAASAHQNLIDTYNWTIIDAGQE